MPNGQIQVGDTATNPQTGKKIKWDGKAWVPLVEPEGMATKIGRGAALGTFSGLGIPETKNPVQDLIKSIGTQAPDLLEKLDPTAGGISGLVNMGKGLYGSGKETAEGIKQKDPELIAHGAVSGLTKLLMLRGLMKFPEVAEGGSEVVSAAKGAAKGVQRVAQEAVIGKPEVENARIAHEAAESQKLAEHAQRVEENRIQNERDLQLARSEHEKELARIEKEYGEKVQEVGKKTTEDEAAYKTKVEQAKDDYAKKQNDLHGKYEDNVRKLGKAEEASAKETGAETRRKSLMQQPRSGPVYQRLAGMADQVAQSVTKLDKSIRTAYNARYNAFRLAMKDEEGNPLHGNLEPVQQAVVDAESNDLKGSPENIAIFRNILAEGEDPLLSQASVFRGGSRGVDLKEVLGSMRSEGERARFLRGLQDEGISLEGEAPGPKEGATLPIDELQGYSTELGNKMYGGKFPSGDIWRALKHVKEAADNEILRVADSKGQGAIKRRLDSDWAQYMGDFYDSDGALYKVKSSINSDTRISLLSGGEGTRIVDSMGRYSRFFPKDADYTSSVGRVRSLVKQLRELPSAPGKAPGEVPPPRFPERPKPREMPERPTGPQSVRISPRERPARPETKPFSSEAYRREHIQKISEHLSRMTGFDPIFVGYAIRELLTGEFPTALAYPVGKRFAARLLSRPGVVEYLSKELPSAPQAP